MTRTRSLTLNGIKREKNFIAVLDKGYQRHVNEEWPIWNEENPAMSLIGFVRREMIELETAIDILRMHQMNRERLGEASFVDDDTFKEQIRKSMIEVGDVSNTLDYLFDALDALERSLTFRGEM